VSLATRYFDPSNCLGAWISWLIEAAARTG
jgi:hypothetical protein